MRVPQLPVRLLSTPRRVNCTSWLMRKRNQPTQMRVTAIKMSRQYHSVVGTIDEGSFSQGRWNGEDKTRCAARNYRLNRRPSSPSSQRHDILLGNKAQV